MERGLSRYLRHRKAIGSVDKTITYHRQSIGDLLSFPRGQGHSLQLDDLHADDVLNWLAAQRDRGLSQETVPTTHGECPASAPPLTLTPVRWRKRAGVVARTLLAVWTTFP